MNLAVDLKQRVLSAVRETPSPVRSDVKREARIAALGSLVVAMGLFFALGGPSHASGRPPWWVAASTGTWACVAAGSLWGAWRSGSSVAAPSARWLAAIALGTPALLMVMLLGFVWIDPKLAALHADRDGLRCFVLTLATAACPLAGLSTLRRSSDPVHPLANGAALGVASGACAGVMVDLWCPVAAPWHVAVGHIAPILVLAVLGAVLGVRLIAMRARQDPRGRTLGP
jgi:hypothetical protein